MPVRFYFCCNFVVEFATQIQLHLKNKAIKISDLIIDVCDCLNLKEVISLNNYNWDDFNHLKGAHQIQKNEFIFFSI